MSVISPYKRVVRKTVAYFLVSIFVTVSIFPVLWTFLTSLKTRTETYAIPPVWFFKPNFRSYYKVFEERALGDFFFNSTVIALSTTGIVLLVASLTAYSLSKFRPRGGRFIVYFILLFRMIPPLVLRRLLLYRCSF